MSADSFFGGSAWRRLEINGGRVIDEERLRLTLSPPAEGYADAQIDDYGGRWRSRYPWRPGVKMVLRARFSHAALQLRGTAGFGFWNAPFGDPTVPFPAFPQAVWFFFGSSPGDLPLNPNGPGRGWFAATVDAARWRARLLVPLAPLVILLNRWTPFRLRFWPRIQRALGMSYAQLDQIDLTRWHTYELRWQKRGSFFSIDGRPVHQTAHSPRGPLGFVCWLDNQFLAVSPAGRVRYGTLPLAEDQWLEVELLTLSQIPVERS